MSDENYVSGEEYQSMRQSKSGGQPKITIQSRTIGFVAALVVLCGLSFIGGISYQKHHVKTVATTTTANSNRLPGGGFGQRRAGGFGQVSSVTSDSITVTSQRTGTSTTYSLTTATTITDNGQAIAATAIQIGDTVIITTAGTGSTVATQILVNPSFGGPAAAGNSATTQNN